MAFVNNEHLERLAAERQILPVIDEVTDDLDRARCARVDFLEFGVEMTGDDPRHGGLADPRGAGKEKGVWWAVAIEAALQFGHHFAMAQHFAKGLGPVFGDQRLTHGAPRHASSMSRP